MGRQELYLEKIKTDLRSLGNEVERSLTDSVRALLTRDRALASETALRDKAINRETWKIDTSCHDFIGKYPSQSSVLRFVTSVLRVTVGLERMGDYAVTISREAVQLERDPPAALAAEVQKVSDHGVEWLHEALDAFVADDSRRAEQVHEKTSRRLRRPDILEYFQRMVEDGKSGKASIEDLFALLVVFSRLERVGDHARNVCEETIYDVKAQPKQPKVYRILFIDEKNQRLSQMAAAIARKDFPQSGEYLSGGWAPAATLEHEALDEDMLLFMQERGVNLRNLRPVAMARNRETLEDFNVIVSVGGDPWPHLGKRPPFYPLVFAWDVAGEAGDSGSALEARYAFLQEKIRALMTALRGDDAH